MGDLKADAGGVPQLSGPSLESGDICPPHPTLEPGQIAEITRFGDRPVKTVIIHPLPTASVLDSIGKPVAEALDELISPIFVPSYVIPLRSVGPPRG